MAPRLILASASPRRSELLRAAGFDFRVALSSVAESASRALTIRELTTLNATRKALQIARANPEAVVLGADTLVFLEGEAIGKPGDLAEAAAMLRRLSGRTHRVCSAVCLAHLSRQRTTNFHEMTEVTFRRLSEAEIAQYFRTINPLDKAGAYAAQEGGEAIIQKVKGSFSNVVGLPMERTTAALRRFGIRPQPAGAGKSKRA